MSDNASTTTPPPRLQRPARSQLLAWLALTLTLLITLFLWRYYAQEFEARDHDRFRLLAERQRALLVDRMHDYEQVLQGASGLFTASREVERPEFRKYVATLDLTELAPGLQGIGFAAQVPREMLEAHEKAVRADGFPLYSVRPAGVRDVYTPIVFIEPFADRNLRALGFDMYSEPVRRAAMDRAARTGGFAVSANVRLVQDADSDTQPGFLMYLAVYASDRPHDTTEARVAALRGFVYSPFRAIDLMRGVFGHTGDDVLVEVYDGEVKSRQLLYASPGASDRSRQRLELPVDVGGHLWTLRFLSGPGLEGRASTLPPQVVLFGGMLISLLVFLFLYSDARHGARLELLVQERTADLVHARDEAQVANRAKNAFLATVSHELRTPLNAIIGFSTVLELDVGSSLAEEHRRQLRIVRQSAEQLLDLIKEILDVSSIEAGQLRLQVEPVRVRALLDEQCAMLRPQAEAAGLTLAPVDVGDEIYVMADPQRLRQVVRNLLSNAIKYTDRGTVTVGVRVEGDFARIDVTDTGIGIDAAKLPLLFQPFQRLGDSKSQRVRPGTGLGLAITRRLVDAMGGAVGVDSTAGQGSRFWFTVPLVSRPASTVAS